MSKCQSIIGIYLNIIIPPIEIVRERERERERDEREREIFFCFSYISSCSGPSTTRRSVFCVRKNKKICTNKKIKERRKSDDKELRTKFTNVSIQISIQIFGSDDLTTIIYQFATQNSSTNTHHRIKTFAPPCIHNLHRCIIQTFSPVVRTRREHGENKFVKEGIERLCQK